VRFASVLVAAFTVLAFPLIGAGPAAAETWSVRDPEGDVTLLEVAHCPPRCDESTRVVDRPWADLTRFSLNYRKEVLRFRIARGAASTSRATRVDLSLGIIAPERQGFAVAVLFPVGRDPRIHVFGTGADGGGGRVRCRAATAAEHGRRWRVDLPASCLGTPDWVRIGAVAVASLPAGPTRLSLLADDALTDGREQIPSGELGPRIRRD
jgi:hypothetical protein